MSARPIRFLMTTEDFFQTNPKKLRVEQCPVLNRTYFVHRGTIVAVATYPQPQQGDNR